LRREESGKFVPQGLSLLVIRDPKSYKALDTSSPCLELARFHGGNEWMAAPTYVRFRGRVTFNAKDAMLMSGELAPLICARRQRKRTFRTTNVDDQVSS
jgi:hypothetical protein